MLPTLYNHSRAAWLKVTALSLVICLCCSCPGPDPVPPAPDPNPPDLAALVTVVKDVYQREGRGRIIFLRIEASEGSEGLEVTEAEAIQARSIVSMDLGVRVLSDDEALIDVTDDSLPALTPTDPTTGEIGLSIGVGRFRHLEDGMLQVNVSYARSGLDGGTVQYILDPVGESWRISERITGAVAKQRPSP